MPIFKTIKTEKLKISLGNNSEKAASKPLWCMYGIMMSLTRGGSWFSSGIYSELEIGSWNLSRWGHHDTKSDILFINFSGSSWRIAIFSAMHSEHFLVPHLYAGALPCIDQAISYWMFWSFNSQMNLDKAVSSLYFGVFNDFLWLANRFLKVVAHTP